MNDENKKTGNRQRAPSESLQKIEEPRKSFKELMTFSLDSKIDALHQQVSEINLSRRFGFQKKNIQS